MDKQRAISPVAFMGTLAQHIAFLKVFKRVSRGCAPAREYIEMICKN